MNDEPKSQHESDAPEADAEWFAQLSDAALEVSGASEAAKPGQDPALPAADVVYLPAVERERPPRPPLISRRTLVIIGSTVAALIVIIVASLLISSSRQVTVPLVTGLTLGQAEERLDQLGLDVEVSERRFSAEPKETVLEQSPRVGSELKKGGVVTLVISAGSEDFPMPDVIGSLAATARSLLEAKGLIVSVEPVMSEAPSDTVMSSIPATGAQVRTGDRVVLQVAAASAPGVTLQPYDLTGVAVTLDPSPAAAGTTDIPLEVARRVRALLEASGATVVTLRSSSDTDTTDASRAARAVAATSVVAVGFDLTPAPQTGRIVRSPSQASAQILTASTLLASAIASELVSVAAPVVSDTTPTDPVLSAVSVPWVRVLLGSGTAREDQAVFTDPTWADKVARAVYVGIGKSYGVVRQP